MKAPSKKRPGRPTTKLTREEVAARLGTSVSTVRSYEKKGRLPSSTDRDGKARFAPAVVDALVDALAESAPPRIALSASPSDTTAPATPREEERMREYLREHMFGSTEGKRQGLVFALLNQGLSCVDVTIRTGIEIVVVREIHKLWQMPGIHIKPLLPKTTDEAP